MHPFFLPYLSEIKNVRSKWSKHYQPKVWSTYQWTIIGIKMLLVNLSTSTYERNRDFG